MWYSQLLLPRRSAGWRASAAVCWEVWMSWMLLSDVMTAHPHSHVSFRGFTVNLCNCVIILTMAAVTWPCLSPPCCCPCSRCSLSHQTLNIADLLRFQNIFHLPKYTERAFLTLCSDLCIWSGNAVEGEATVLNMAGCKATPWQRVLVWNHSREFPTTLWL